MREKVVKTAGGNGGWFIEIDGIAFRHTYA